MNSSRDCAIAQLPYPEESIPKLAPFLWPLDSPWDFSIGWRRALRVSADCPVYQRLRADLASIVDRSENGRNQSPERVRAAEATLQALIAQLDRLCRTERWQHAIGQHARVHLWQPSGRDWFSVNGCTVFRQPLERLVATMVKSGLLDQTEVANDQGGGRKRFLRPTTETIALIGSIERRHILLDGFPEPIRLKSAEGNYVRYRDNRKIKRMRRSVNLINKSNAEHQFRLRIPEDRLHVVPAQGMPNSKLVNDYISNSWSGIEQDSSPSLPLPLYRTQHSIDSALTALSATKTFSENGARFADISKLTSFYRVFKHDFDSYGRFYAPFQNVPTEWRGCIEIDGQPTVEIDFSAMHGRLLYHRLGVPYDGDPYDVNDWERDQVKTAFLIVLNCSGRHAASVSIAKELVLDAAEAWELLRGIERQHQPLHDAGFFYSCAARPLQHLDSRIAENVMLAFAGEHRPILGVHDSFLVRVDDQERLREAMIAAYREMSGFDPVLK